MTMAVIGLVPEAPRAGHGQRRPRPPVSPAGGPDHPLDIPYRGSPPLSPKAAPTCGFSVSCPLGSQAGRAVRPVAQHSHSTQVGESWGKPAAGVGGRPPKTCPDQHFCGGDDGTRTHDPLLAKQGSRSSGIGRLGRCPPPILTQNPHLPAASGSHLPPFFVSVRVHLCHPSWGKTGGNRPRTCPGGGKLGEDLAPGNRPSDGTRPAALSRVSPGEDRGGGHHDAGEGEHQAPDLHGPGADCAGGADVETLGVDVA
jgi:hypothetical protein